jgi:hypothetical protein
VVIGEAGYFRMASSPINSPGNHAAIGLLDALGLDTAVTVGKLTKDIPAG